MHTDFRTYNVHVHAHVMWQLEKGLAPGAAMDISYTKPLAMVLVIDLLLFPLPLLCLVSLQTGCKCPVLFLSQHLICSSTLSEREGERERGGERGGGRDEACAHVHVRVHAVHTGTSP